MGKTVLDMSVASAVVSFNDGATGLFSIMEKIGIHVGHFNLSLSHNADLVRIAGWNIKIVMDRNYVEKNFMHRKRVILLNRTDIMVLACIENLKLSYLLLCNEMVSTFIWSLDPPWFFLE